MSLCRRFFGGEWDTRKSWLLEYAPRARDLTKKEWLL